MKDSRLITKETFEKDESRTIIKIFLSLLVFTNIFTFILILFEDFYWKWKKKNKDIILST